MLEGSEINIGIYESDRREIAEQLSVLLADSYLLYLKCQNYHWNVTGREFRQLHSLFEEQYQELGLAMDEIAESIRKLGFLVPASFSDFSRRTSIQEQVKPMTSTEMILDLLIGHEVVIESSRVVFETAQQAEDYSTADLSVRRITSHEKSAWMLRSTLEG